MERWCACGSRDGPVSSQHTHKFVFRRSIGQSCSATWQAHPILRRRCRIGQVVQHHEIAISQEQTPIMRSALTAPVFSRPRRSKSYEDGQRPRTNASRFRAACAARVHSPAPTFAASHVPINVVVLN